MNNLYEAVMILGRSEKIVEQTGWACGHIGCSTGPKCVNGVVTMGAGAREPMYVYDMPRSLHAALILVGKALIETTPDEVLEHYQHEVLEHYQPTPCGFLGTIGELGDALVSINDTRYFSEEVDEDGEEIYEPVLDEKLALSWFKAAFDRLASQLPEPLPALTVEEILSVPIQASEPLILA